MATRTFSPEHIMKLKIAASKRLKGKDNRSWKGDDATRYAIQNYMHKNTSKPDKCPVCRLDKKLRFYNVSKNYDPKTYNRDPKNWYWSCVECRTIRTNPKQLRYGKLSDHLCECLRKCGEPTKYNQLGEPNQFIVGHNSAGKILPANWIPGTADDPMYRQRWHWWVKKYAYKPSNCPVCDRKLLPNKAKTISRSGKYLRDKNDCVWTCRYGICSGKIEEGMIVK